MCIEILKDDQEQMMHLENTLIILILKYAYKRFQEHIDPRTAQLETTYFDLGTAAIDFGDVYNDGYTHCFVKIGHNQLLVINRLGPAVNVTFPLMLTTSIEQQNHC